MRYFPPLVLERIHSYLRSSTTFPPHYTSLYLNTKTNHRSYRSFSNDFSTVTSTSTSTSSSTSTSTALSPSPFSQPSSQATKTNPTHPHDLKDHQTNQNHHIDNPDYKGQPYPKSSKTGSEIVRKPRRRHEHTSTSVKVTDNLSSVLQKIRRLLHRKNPSFHEALSLAHQYLNFTALSNDSNDSNSKAGSSLGGLEAEDCMNTYDSVTETATSASSLTNSTLNRQQTFTQLLAPFLTHSSPQSQPSIRSLLNRLSSEHIPPSTITLTQILHRSLFTRSRLSFTSPSSTSTISTTATDLAYPRFSEPIIPFIQRFLHTLPPTLDPHLVALIIRATIRETSPSPTTVRSMLIDCLGEDTSTWGLAMWDVLISSYALPKDFRGALKVLGEMKRVLLGLNKSDSDSDSSLSNSSNMFHGPGWKQAQDIAKPYTTLMNIWISSRFNHVHNSNSRSPRIGSHLPQALAHDLEHLLIDCGIRVNGDQDSFQHNKRAIRHTLPVSFLTSWMNAERVAGNISASSSIFQRIATPPLDYFLNLPPSGPTVDFLLDPASISPHPRRPLLADVRIPALLVLIKLVKMKSPHTWRPITHHILSHPSIALLHPSRHGIDSFTSTRLSEPVIDILEQLLSALCSSLHPDLPLISLTFSFLPLHRMKARTIDIVAASLIRAWRKGQAPGVFLVGHTQARRVRGRLKVGIHYAEWDMLSRALHSVRLQEAAKLMDMTDDERVKVTLGEMTRHRLPLASPMGSTSPDSTRDPENASDREALTHLDSTFQVSLAQELSNRLTDSEVPLYPLPPPTEAENATFAPIPTCSSDPTFTQTMTSNSLPGSESAGVGTNGNRQSEYHNDSVERVSTVPENAPFGTADLKRTISVPWNNRINAKAQALAIPLKKLINQAIINWSRHVNGHCDRLNFRDQKVLWLEMKEVMRDIGMVKKRSRKIQPEDKV